MLVDLGNGSTQVFFQGLWYRDRLIRTPDGWRMKELVEEGYWKHTYRQDSSFDMVRRRSAHWD